MEIKESLEDYTETDFLDLLRKIWAVDVPEEEHNKLIRHVTRLAEHPSGTDLLFYPEEGTEHSPEGIITVINKWRAANGKPGFKPA